MDMTRETTMLKLWASLQVKVKSEVRSRVTVLGLEVKIIVGEVGRSRPVAGEKE